MSYYVLLYMLFLKKNMCLVKYLMKSVMCGLFLVLDFMEFCVGVLFFNVVVGVGVILYWYW